MEYIHKLPFLLSAFMAIVIGMISYMRNIAQQQIYVQMVICMVIFFIIGLFIRSTIEGIYKDINRKKEEENAKKLEEQKLQAENESQTGEPTINIEVGDSFDEEGMYDEDFAPLAVKEILKG